MEHKQRKSNKFKVFFSLTVAAALVFSIPLSASAHCDTMDGPTVADGLKAMDEANVSYAMKWVQPDYSEELEEVFDLSMKVRSLNPEAKELSEKYFLDNLVRIHRAGEGEPFTGVKPTGTPVDEKVQAADESIAKGDLTPLEGMVEEDQMPELQERFERVMALKDFDPNDVEAGREYIEAYVMFFKFAEGEEGHGAHGAEETQTDVHEAEEAENSEADKESAVIWLPWALAGLFFITTVVSHIKLFGHMKHMKHFKK